MRYGLKGERVSSKYQGRYEDFIMKKLSRLLILFLIPLVTACGGGGGGGGSSTANVAGNWTGTWASNKVLASGTISATITQSGTTFSGSMILTGSPCFSNGAISGGTFSGDTVSWISPGIVNFTGTVSGNTINGSYFVTLAGACYGDTGTFSVTRAPHQTVTTQILSDPVYDGDIALTTTASYTVAQGMTQTVQSVFAGINPVTGTEYRAFLDFPLTGANGVPGNAIIVSAFLDFFVNSIDPTNGTIPIRIELVDIPGLTLVQDDFSRTLQPSLAFTTIVPPISQADVGYNVTVDVTSLMVEAQNLGLLDFQVRILEDLGSVPPGLVEIDDTTGPNRAALAPLLQVTYY